MNKAQREIRRSAKAYPDLFGTDEHADTRALIHVLTLNGCGYEWVDGEIVNVCEGRERVRDVLDREHREIRAKMRRETNETMPMISSHFSRKWSLLGTVPDDAKPEWLEIIRG